MNRFFDLIAAPASFSPEKGFRSDADRLFPEIVRRSHFHWWNPGDAIQATGMRILIGVATWSGYDLKLLDAVNDVLQSKLPSPIQVDVMNVGLVPDSTELHRCFPGASDFVQTPFLGVWNDGQVQMFRQGHHAIRELSLLFHVNPDEIAESVQRFYENRLSVIDQPISHAS